MIKDRLKYVRENKYKTQDYVANKLGIARSTYSEYENGDTLPPVAKLCNFALMFNVSLDYLLGISSDKKPYDKIQAFDYDVFIENVINIRKNRGYSQKFISEKLLCSESTVNRYENKARFLPADFLIGYSKLVGVSSDYITGIISNK